MDEIVAPQQSLTRFQHGILSREMPPNRPWLDARLEAAWHG
ncbi:hypothetical protein [Kitasatospora sp. NPDC088264]